MVSSTSPRNIFPTCEVFIDSLILQLFEAGAERFPELDEGAIVRVTVQRSRPVEQVCFLE